MAWLRHTWRNLARRHVALPAVVVFGPLLVVALVAVLVVQSTAGTADDTTATTVTTTAPDTTTPDADPAFLTELPSSCVTPEEPTCALRTGSLALVSDSGTVELQPDGVVRVEGDLSIPTAGGAVDLIDSSLVIEVGDDGDIVDIEGTAEAPLPDFGALSAALVVVGARAEVGYDWGRDLLDLGAHVNPDRQYFWFRFESTWAMRTGFDQVVGDADSLPVSLSTPGDVSVTMVLDPIDPYFYIGGPCPEFDTDSDDNGDNGGGGSDSGGSQRGSGNSESRSGANAEVQVGGAVGEDCGLGVSQEGNIAFEADTSHEASAEFQPFDGHIVIDHSEIPVMTGVVLDGTMVVRAGSFLALGGNGDILLSVPMVPDALDLSIRVGNASTGLRLPKSNTGGVVDAFIAGVADSELLRETLPDWMPIEPSQQAEVLASARIVADAGEDQPLGADSYIEMTGSMGTRSSFLAELTAVPVSPIESADALVRIDPAGITVNGTATATIHPALDIGGDLLLDGYVGLADPTASYFELVGAAGIGGFPLSGNTSIRLIPGAALVSGATTTPLTTIELQGRLGDDDVDLRGSARVEASTDRLTALIDRAAGLADDARAALGRIDTLVDEAREGVRQARDAAVAAAEEAVAEAERLRTRVSARLSDARDDLDDLSDDLEDVLDDIVSTVGDVIERLIPKELRDARDRLEHAIEDARDTIDDLRDDLAAADDAVRAAAGSLDALVEEHREVAVDEVREVAERLAERRPIADSLAAAERAASALTGTAALDIELQLATSGLTGVVTGEVCSADGCLDVAGGAVRFDDEPEACFTVIGVDACLPF